MARAGPLVLCFLVFLVGARASGTWDLVVLHTNDVHARVEETSGGAGICGGRGGCYGGVARRATAVRRVRDTEAGALLLLDAGDQFQGTVWFNVYRGAEAAHFMNRLRYDAMALGNHEFDNGVEGLMTPFLQDIRCPVLSANIITDETLASTFGKAYMPYKILRVGGRDVGVVGYTSEETPALSKPGPHLKFGDEVTALQLQVDKLRTLGVDTIVALGHSGFTKDQEIARRVRGVDVVVGGHSNTFLYSGPAPSSEVPAGPYPFLVESEDGRQVPVVQAYAFGKYLGYLRLTFDSAGNVVNSSGNPILLDSSIPQDPDILAEVEQWKKSLANYSAQVVGRTLVFLNGSTEECRFRECNLGNLICDAMLENSMGFSDGRQWNHVSACILNGGSVRSSISEQTRNGTITIEDVISVQPFGGTADLVELRGSTLREVFEHSVRRYGQSTGEFLQVSGFRVVFDLSAAPQQRVRSLSILCTECRVPRYEPVQDQGVYKVVLPSYLASGGDGYTMIRDKMLKHNSGDLDITIVTSFISRRQMVHPGIEGRITFYNSAPGRTVPLVLLTLLVLFWSLDGIF